MSIWIKHKQNIYFRYVLSFVSGVVLSTILNDIHTISVPLESFVSSLNFNKLLTNLTVNHIKMFGIPATISDNQIVIGDHGFYFAYGCLGIRHISLFAGFVLTYFGKFYQKLVYIFIGTLVLTAANVSRATLIGVTIWFDYDLFNIVHKYGTILILYGTIFILWIIWSKTNNR